MECNRLLSPVRYWDNNPTHFTRQRLDETWLDQHIFEIEKEQPQPGPNSDPANNFGHCFEEESYNPLETFAVIVVIGEEAQVREMMASKLFPQHPHMPSATEVYSMQREGCNPFTRHFLRKYRRHPGLVKRKDLELEIWAEDAQPRLESVLRSGIPSGLEPLAKR